MNVFDTDHISLLQRARGENFDRLSDRLADAVLEEFSLSAVSFEEQSRGWLAAISRTKEVQGQPYYYGRLVGLVSYYSRWKILPFDEEAADKFIELRSQKIRIGTMDLKIASIVLVNEATLLSANLRDFQQVPGLDVQDWSS